MKKKSLTIAAVAATLGLAALPGHARDDRAAGALLGAGIGALIGSSVNGPEGAMVGGLLGAVTGAAISHDGYGHHPRYARHDRHGHYDRYDRRYQGRAYARQAPSYYSGRPAYVQRYAPGYTRAYNDGYYREGYYRDGGYGRRW